MKPLSRMQALAVAGAGPIPTPLSLPILAKYLKLDPAAIRGMVRAQFATSLEPAQIQPIIDAGVKYKLIPQPLDIAGAIAKI